MDLVLSGLQGGIICLYGLYYHFIGRT